MTLDPAALANGFYQVRLTAIDLSGRMSTTQMAFEVNSAVKSAQYAKAQTDLSFTMGGTVLNLVRSYDSLNASDAGELGYGWRLANTETNLQTNVPLTGQEQFGIYSPLQVGSRLYLTLPTGDRVGFTFAPQVQSQPGVIYYTPAWVADPGVSYRLDSAQTLLSRGEDRFYDLKSAQAYNPQSDYTLTAPDGTIYRLDATGIVQEQVNPNGTRFVFSDGGIVSSTGESIRFVNDAQGRLTQVTTSGGTTVSYSYDGSGNLTMVRNLAQGVSQRYGYDASHRLTLASALGQLGESVGYTSGAPQVRTIQSDLGGAYQLTTGSAVLGSLSAGQSQRYTFSLRDSEILSTATDFVLVGVDVSGGALPGIQGLSPLVSRVSGTDAYGLFAIEKSGLNLLEVTGSAGNYRIDLSIAGDLNRDGLVDGLDSQLLNLALGSHAGDAGYRTSYDLNRDLVIDGTDVQILGSNYGFIANRPPVVTPSTILTHKDLETRVSLTDTVKDPEGDAVFYRLLNPVNGTVQVSADGKGVVFVPTPEYVGAASFDLIADDGFSSSAPTTITLNVSGAALINLDFLVRGTRLKAGEQYELQAVGDFADQKGVFLPDSYLTYGSDRTNVASVDTNGLVTGLTDGVSILSVSRGNIQAVTALRVGRIPTPSNQQELNSVLAEENGLNLYPLAIMLSPDGKRQLKVGINELVASPDLRYASTGTRYFTSNPSVFQVGADGLITGIGTGVGNVTVIQGGTEEVIPVKVELPHLGATVLGIDGGIVQSTDGATVFLAQGALEQNTSVTIQQVLQENLPVAMPDDFDFVGAFQLQVGASPLDLPAQIAIPAPPGIAVGKEVFFMRQEMLPDETGVMRPVWLIEESGIVGADGFVRTQSPPWSGAKNSGLYTIAVPKFDYEVFVAPVPAEWRISIGLGFFAVGLATAAISAPIALVAVGAGALLVGSATLDDYTTNIKTSVNTLVIPQVGLPYRTNTNVSLNLAQLDPQGSTLPIATIEPPASGNSSPLNPNIKAGEIGFDENKGAFIRIKSLSE